MAKLLLVEDDNNLRDIYQARLAAEGYEISSAQDGEEALVVAKQAKPDLIISDVMMPKISGFEMLDILRNTPGLENVRVIMLTALGQSEDQQRADSLGADKYLVKSQVTLEDIVKTARELLDGETAEAETAVAASGATSDTASDAAAAAAPAQPVTPEPVAVEPMPVAEAPAATPADDTPAAPQAPAAAAPADDTTVSDDAATAAADDQLVQEAVDELAEGTTPDPAPAPETAAPAEEAPAAAGSKKVISPLQSEPKASLDELVAKEAAAESEQTQAAATPAPEAPAVTDSSPAEPTSEPSPEETAPAPAEEQKKDDGVDPNSLAL